MSRQEKQEIRERLANQRAKMDEKSVRELSSRIVDVLYRQIENYILELGTEKNIIFAYAAKGNEVDLSSLFELLWKRNEGFSQKVGIALPRVHGKHMDFYVIESMDDLEDGIFGVREPKLKCKKVEAVNAIVITPAIAYGMDGTRIGYGAGYYDRYFKQDRANFLIGAAYEFQTDVDFTGESYDICVDAVATENGIRYI